MRYCIRCRRPLKRPTESGMGPVCAKKSAPLPQYERDLLGFDIDRACEVARERIERHIQVLTTEAHIAMRKAFDAARKRLGVRP